jgi:hypothetical protein
MRSHRLPITLTGVQRRPVGCQRARPSWRRSGAPVHLPPEGGGRGDCDDQQDECRQGLRVLPAHGRCRRRGPVTFAIADPLLHRGRHPVWELARLSIASLASHVRIGDEVTEEQLRLLDAGDLWVDGQAFWDPRVLTEDSRRGLLAIACGRAGHIRRAPGEGVRSGRRVPLRLCGMNHARQRPARDASQGLGGCLLARNLWDIECV